MPNLSLKPIKRTPVLTKLNILLLSLLGLVSGTNNSNCTTVEVSITQRIDGEGFHRSIDWLIEATTPSTIDWLASKCQLVLRVEVPLGMFVNPDQLIEIKSLKWLLDGVVDVEAPAHESQSHLVYIYLDSSQFERATVALPVHMRYQRAQITGGYGKVPFSKPSLLIWCPKGLESICGRGLKVEAPCNHLSLDNICIWRNFTYEAHFDDVDLFVPVGDLDHYPLVSIVTLLLGCAGCIYVLSILSTTPL